MVGTPRTAYLSIEPHEELTMSVSDHVLEDRITAFNAQLAAQAPAEVVARHQRAAPIDDPDPDEA